jgi:hypothetical protein
MVITSAEGSKSKVSPVAVSFKRSKRQVLPID